MAILNRLKLYFLTAEHLDCFYRLLKREYVHFSIIIMEPLDLELYQNHEQLQVGYVHEKVTRVEASPKQKSGCEYPFAIFTAPLNVLNVSSVIKAEKMLHTMIPSNYQYTFSLHTSEYEYRKFPVYQHLKHPPGGVRKKLIVSNTKGYGNSMIDMPILQNYCKANLQEGYEITVWHSFDESMHLAEVFLRGAVHCKNPYIDISNIAQILGRNNEEDYCEIINMDNLILRSSYTKFDELCQYFHVQNDRRLLDDLTVEELTLDEPWATALKAVKSKYRACIGVHFQTYDDDLCATKRSWSTEHVKSFISLCHKNNTGVINLAPYIGPAAGFDLDCAELPINKLFSVFPYLDAFVGIESACAHMAGVLRKPNLMILGKPVDHVNQRPLSRNHTIISKSGEIDDILPEFVWDHFNRLYERQLPLSAYTQRIYDFQFTDPSITVI